MAGARGGAGSGKRVTARVRFALFVLLFGAATIAIYGVTALCELARPGAVHAGARVWGRAFRAVARGVLGIRLVVRGRVPVGAVLVAAKHQSLYETIVLLDVLDSPAIVLKRELLALPLWRFFARRHGSIAVDRAANAAALRAMLGAARAVGPARAILIFPEGERTLPGDAPPVRPGVSALYAALARPVVLLALDSGRVWPKGGVPRAGVVTMRFGAPIAPGQPRPAFEAALRAAMNEDPRC